LIFAIDATKPTKFSSGSLFGTVMLSNMSMGSNDLWDGVYSEETWSEIAE
jgi:hypothetical protein